jgi:hypothetical protein
MGGDDLVNQGVILRPANYVPAQAQQDPTFIVSGIGRGGTTLIASLLREAGLYLGDQVADIVHEDDEILHLLRSRAFDDLDALIARRNARGGPWGFKAPVVQGFFKPSDLARFRNPHLICVFRDPVAIAVRSAMAEQEPVIPYVRESARSMAGLATFAERATCPVLLLSYEKCLLFPATLVDTIMRFCALGIDADLRRRLLIQVNPNDTIYANHARRVFEGMIDTVVGTKLLGWCWQKGSDETFDVDLCLDGRITARTRADQFRGDLQDAGIGNGRHAFAFDLTPFNAGPDTVVTVNMTGKTFELPNGSKPLRAYAAAPATQT